MKTTESILDELARQAVVVGSKVGAALLILLGFWLASVLAKKVICRLGRAADPAKQDILDLIGQIAKTGILVFGLVTALGTAGVNVSALVAGLGLTGFALGFAFRDALSNLLAGFLILIYHPFHRGDRIAVAEFEGTVIGIDLRYTMLQGQSRIYLIPNSTLFTNAITLVKGEPDRPSADPGPGRSTPAADRA